MVTYDRLKNLIMIFRTVFIIVISINNDKDFLYCFNSGIINNDKEFLYCFNYGIII